ncbi:MAG TPA: M14 metallopeptidase family protein [Vicinamibacterales bacterium]|nr:M14 metallopeptidase family protein [Vicinamibacterales bacterium]
MDAQEPALWPGAKYDAAIPTIKSVLGHDHGEVITPPDGIERYLRALQAAAPTKTRMIEYARTWEGRPLWLFVIGGPERIAKLDQVKADMQRLADPRRLQSGEAERLIKQLPVVVWLMHGVHGNEISSADAALVEAYHLLAAQGDADVDLVLRDALVLIDPMQNPDGRARFVSSNLQGRAATADPAPYSAEHDEPWPGGRSNHYLFDMNRDWFAQTQPETRGRIKIGLEYQPQITVDLHEQGGDNFYYFSPPAEAINPHVTKSQIAAWELLGRANAARFDERGWPYYIREVYDAFYPGYGDSWPTFQGSIGNTYEQASARGLVFARSDGDTLTYRDGVMHHFNAAIVTAITAARNRERLLRDYFEYRRTAIAEGEKAPIREYVIVPGEDLSRAALLARNLATQGIEVRRAEEPIKLASRTIPAGAYIVSNAQPTARMIRNLLDPRTEQSPEFIKKQEERRKMRLNDQIYDITAWNLPMLYDAELVTSPTAITVKTSNVPPQYDAPFAARPLTAAKVGYLVPWGSAAVALAADAMKQGIRIRSVGGAFTHNGRRYPIGTAFIRNTENAADLPAKLSALMTKHGAEIVPIDSTWVDEGTSLGSNDVAALKAPKVLLAWDTPTQSLSAGWMRFALERRFGIGATAVRTASLARANFNDYDVVVLPSGNYSGSINDAVLNRLKDWLRSGGTLVTVAEATRWATGSSVGLLDTTGLLKDGRPDVPPPGGGSSGSNSSSGSNAKPVEFDYDKAIQPERERPASQPGAILRVTLDTNHWLTAGNDNETQVMIEGNRVFAPLKLNSGRNVGVYGTKDKLIASGLIWPDAQDILVQKAFLMHQPFGQGHVIAFAEDPNYRAFTEATMLLFANAVMLGPGY